MFHSTTRLFAMGVSFVLLSSRLTNASASQDDALRLRPNSAQDQADERRIEHLQAAPSARPRLTFYVTGFGINQYTGKEGTKNRLETGDNFAKARSAVFPNRPNQGQILVVMPSLENFANLSNSGLSQLSEQIFNTLKSSVASSLSQGIRSSTMTGSATRSQ